MPSRSLSVIVCGDPPFDRATLETSRMLPATPHSVLFCSDVPGDTVIARGQALLAEIRRRKENGEFSVFTPTVICMHGNVHNGELLVGDAKGTLSVSLQVLLRALCTELFDSEQPRTEHPLGPVVISGCFAGLEAVQLKDFPRPILINATEDELFVGDAQATFRTSVRLADSSWQSGSPLRAEQWFEQLAAVSGEVLHLTGQGRSVLHHPLDSTTSLESISLQQARLYLRKTMLNGSVDDLAEALLLFGTGALDYEHSAPPIHFLLETGAPDLRAKIVLLSSVGVPIDQRDARGNTPLHRLCDPGVMHDDMPIAPGERFALARMLLANGASATVRNRSGQTPRDLAARFGFRPWVEAFDPQRIALDRPATGAANLRATATTNQWLNVISLLDDPTQAMDSDDDTEDIASDEAPGADAAMDWQTDRQPAPADA